MKNYFCITAHLYSLMPVVLYEWVRRWNRSTGLMGSIWVFFFMALFTIRRTHILCFIFSCWVSSSKVSKILEAVQNSFWASFHGTWKSNVSQVTQQNISMVLSLFAYKLHSLPHFMVHFMTVSDFLILGPCWN